RARRSGRGFNPPRRRWTARSRALPLLAETVEVVSTHLAVGGRRGPRWRSPPRVLRSSFNPPRRRWTARKVGCRAAAATVHRFNPPRRRWTARTRGRVVAARPRRDVSTHLAVGGRRGLASLYSVLGVYGFQPTSPSVDGEDKSPLVPSSIVETK